MNKKDKINEFLNFWVEIARSNPNYQFNNGISNDCIYNSLVYFGVKDSDKSVSLRDEPSKVFPTVHKSDLESDLFHSNSTFGNLVHLYKSSRKTNVYVAPNLKNFLQIISSDCRAKYKDNHLKVYIPLDSDHIELGTKLIIDFLEKNKISHFSKMSRRIRFDDLVLRLIDSKDVDRLIKFVNSNNYIRKGLIEPNPFAFSKDNIALAVDGHLSYNSTVASLIDLYIDECKKSNKLDSVNADNFYQFVYDKYKGQFIDKNDNSLLHIFRWRDGEVQKNYREVISLILKSYNTNFSYENLVKHYEFCMQDEKDKLPDVSFTNDLLVETLVKMSKKHSEHMSLRNLEAYLYSGEAQLITSTDNLRRRVVNSKFRQVLNKMLQENKMTFVEYASYVLQEYNIEFSSLAQSKKCN